jgi:purine/pyrimidine-nucleoside phosphorylase
MIPMNEYFDGKVKSLGLSNSQGKFTAGVMLAGEYEFGTSTKEWMTLVSGAWQIKLPGSDVYVDFPVGSTFEVEAGEKFQLILSQDSAYLCRYA